MCQNKPNAKLKLHPLNSYPLDFDQLGPLLFIHSLNALKRYKMMVSMKMKIKMKTKTKTGKRKRKTRKTK